MHIQCVGVPVGKVCFIPVATDAWLLINTSFIIIGINVKQIVKLLIYSLLEIVQICTL